MAFWLETMRSWLATHLNFNLLRVLWAQIAWSTYDVEARTLSKLLIRPSVASFRSFDNYSLSLLIHVKFIMPCFSKLRSLLCPFLLVYHTCPISLSLCLLWGINYSSQLLALRKLNNHDSLISGPLLSIYSDLINSCINYWGRLANPGHFWCRC